MRTSELKEGGNVTVSSFRMPVAAVRPAYSFFTLWLLCTLVN